MEVSGEKLIGVFLGGAEGNGGGTIWGPTFEGAQHTQQLLLAHPFVFSKRKKKVQ